MRPFGLCFAERSCRQASCKWLAGKSLCEISGSDSRSPSDSRRPLEPPLRRHVDPFRPVVCSTFYRIVVTKGRSHQVRDERA
jgi:hypothetical protein